MLIDSDDLRKRIVLRKEICKKFDIADNGQTALDWMLRVISEIERKQEGKPKWPEWLRGSEEEIRTV